MDLSLIKKVVEITSIDQGDVAPEVNSYLKDGWCILYCGTETNDEGSQYVRIILGTDK